MTEFNLIELAMRELQRVRNEPNEELTSVTATVAARAGEVLGATRQPTTETEELQTIPSAPASEGLTHSVPAKEKIAAAQLAAMILEDLSKVEGCPKRGIKVIVYGSNPWNSWLSFGVKAGPVLNKTELQEFCDIITERLKRLYEVSP